MQLTGAEIFVKSLKELGVKQIFGYPGGAVLNIYDELYKQKVIKHTLCRHEQGALHMADAFARVTGKVGTAIVTSGPGATNAVTGLATAYMDSIPMVCFTGQVNYELIGNDAFQEADTRSITRGCTKHNYVVTCVEELQSIITEAYHIAGTGRPGPVVIDIPKDVTANKAYYSKAPRLDLPGYRPTMAVNSKQIDKAFEMILKAKRPVFYIGGGAIAANASKELTSVIRALGVPATPTLMGLGAFPGSDKLSMGMLGMHGTYHANIATHEADLLVSVGARFDDRVTGPTHTFSPNSTKIQIDIDPTSINKTVKVDVPIVGDVLDAMKKFQKLIKSNAAKVKKYKASLKGWHKQIDAWEKKHSLHSFKVKKTPLPQQVLTELNKLTKGKAIIATDVGQHQMWAAQYLTQDEPRQYCTSGGLGTMGYGLPAAIGAKMAQPKKDVWCITGDGSLQMNSQELMTSVAEGLDLKIVLLNNHFLGMVRQWQELFYEKRYAETVMMNQPDWMKLAEAYGAKGILVKKAEDVSAALKKAKSMKGTVIVDIHTEKEEGVYPMVPAGKGNADMLLL